MISIRSLAALMVAAAVMGTSVMPATAISVELAKKCRAMALKAHPYKLPGQPGAGTGEAEREYFNECVAKNGNMPEPSSTGAAPPPAPPGPPKAGAPASPPGK